MMMKLRKKIKIKFKKMKKRAKLKGEKRKKNLIS
jgi:hypothetical protein